MDDYTQATRAALTAWGMDPDSLTADAFSVARAMVRSDAEGTPLLTALTAEERRIARRMGWAD